MEVKLVEVGLVKVLEVSIIEDVDAVELELGGFAEVDGVTLVKVCDVGDTTVVGDVVKV